MSLRALRFVIPMYITLMCQSHVSAQETPQAISFPLIPTEASLVGVSVYSSSTIFRTNLLADGSDAETIRSFCPNGSKPTETLIDGGDGFLYGVTLNGGIKAAGLVYRISPDGAQYEIIHDFQESDGTFPSGGLLIGADGKLYGATELGGQFKHGVIYSLDPNGENFQLLHQFNNFDGSYINGDLIQDASGTLFGMSTNGGNNNGGTVFRLQPDGSGFQVLHSFTGSNGSTPYGGLTEGQDGKLYGLTYSGGSQQAGIIFGMNKDGSGYSIIRNFDMVDGRNPFGRLVQDVNGNFYGFAPSGGVNDNGVIFKINPDGTGYQVLHSFDMPFGSFPRGSPILRNGFLYGATMGGLDPHSVIFKIGTNGSGFELLYGVSAGWEKPTPMGTLLIRSDGTMYGTLSGLDNSIDGGIFRFKPDTEEYDEIHSFEENDGTFPHELLLAGNGRLYGVNTFGGTNEGGVIYSIEPDGSGHIVHHRFQPQDGIKPLNALTQGPDGTLYGSTSTGGSNSAGTLFSIQPSGANFQKLHEFGYTDGSDVRGQLVRDSDGFLFGVTQVGGVDNGGVIFKIHESGGDFEVLHTFIGTTGIDGSNPVGGLTLGSDDLLYGTTYNGGSNGLGTIFSIHKDGSAFQKLFDFNASTGQHSSTRLIEGSQGNLIGLTAEATTFYNSMYSIEKNGNNFNVLKILDYGSGNKFYSSLTPGPNNYLYGTMSTATGWAIYRIKEDGSGFLRMHDLSEPQWFSLYALTLVPLPQPGEEILFNDFSDKRYGDPPFDLVASATSGLQVVFNSSDPGVATISGNTVTITGVGTVTLTASQPGDGQFAAATPVSRSLFVAQAIQTISFDPISPQTFGAGPVPLVASASSGLPLQFMSSDPNVAEVVGTNLIITGVGSAFITATQSGNELFVQPTPFTRTLTVSKGTQSITFDPISPLTFGAAPVDLVASSTSGLALSFSSSNTNVVTVSGQTITIIGGGTALITATQAGNSNYEPAVDVQQPVTVAKANQSLTFNTIPTKVLGDSPFAATATVSSGLPITFTPESTNLSIAGGMVTLISPGKGKIKATQGGNSNYNPVEEVQEFCINPPKPTITFNGVTLTSSATSGNQWYLDSAPLAVNSSSFAPEEAGTYTVVVTADGCASESSTDFVFVITGDLSKAAQVTLKVAPNPAIDRLDLQLVTFNPSTLVKIYIHDLSGKVVDTFSTSAGNLSVDVSRYPEGLYIIRTSLPGHAITKFVVRK